MNQGKVEMDRDRRRLATRVGTVILALALVLVLLLLCRRPTERRYFVEREVLVSGPPDQITAIVKRIERELETLGVTLQLVERVDLEFPLRALAGCDDLPQDFKEDGRYAIDRYSIRGGDLGVADIVRRLQDAAGSGPVRPEPNYLTSSPWSIGGSPWSIGGSPWSIGGSPWSIGGSPWSIGGSPWSIGGSPWSIGGSPAGSAVELTATTAFNSQWAFGEEGIRLDAGGSRAKGLGVLVGIFDTSPFPVTVSRVSLPMDSSFDLDLVHPIPGGPFVGADKLTDIRDHGLFAAGLVYTVAPASEVRLVRVLDNTGQGDLQTLNKALVEFLHEVVERRQETSEQDKVGLRGAVINLSLGVHPPPNAEEQGLPDDVASLQIVLTVAKCLDIVTVAAAGNDSAQVQDPVPPQIPAAWETTIGVAASNADGEMSCFSNEGEILAPGGDGGPDFESCRLMLDTCTGDDCRYALISWSLASPTGYRFWTGTSFSTPLVSGLAAALVDADGGWVPLDQVRSQIIANGRPSSGSDPTTVIADAANTLP